MSERPARPTYSFVLPVMNEEGTLPELHRRLAAVADGLDGETEFVFVDDGSDDRSREILLELRKADPRVRFAALSRNFGHQLALTAGLDLASGDAVVIMDSDLQDPPELIPKLVARWREGYDVVYAVRSRRAGESGFKLRTAHLFYRLMNRASDIDLPLDAGDFRLIDRRVVEVVRNMREPDRYLRGMFAWAGFRQTGVEFDRDARAAGDTKYSLPRLIRFATDGLISFSTVPLRLALALGFAISVFAFLAGLGAIVLKLAGVYAIPGWASVTVMLSFFSGVQLLLLGAVGLYVGRIYEQGKGRPLYLVSEAHGFDRSPASIASVGAESPTTPRRTSTIPDDD
ncbi:MAG: glycosyltransferase family 2 protein [Actinomycetota bacterium]|nr:glycosyltransferase family 2 protein [Actinomycetota bacterium]